MHKGKGKFEYPKCKKVYITKKGQRNCKLKHKGSEKPFKCDVAGYDIGFCNRRLRRSMRGSNMEIMFNRKTNYVSFKMKAVHTGHTLMITWSSIRGYVNSTQIGLNTSVSCVEKEDSIITKGFRSTNTRSTKDTIDFMMFWIHSMYRETYRHIDNKLNDGSYTMDYILVDTVDTMDNTDPQLLITSILYV